MDRRLIEAADKGDVDKLHNLIKSNPLLLKAAALASGDAPLHIASLGGHVNFVKEVLINQGPEFAGELNQDGLSPLHIASGRGDIEIVKELSKVGGHLCLVKGKEKKIPLHYAVAKGRIQVIRELLSVSSDSITEVTARGENCFHLAVKNNQFEALKVLCEHVIKFDKEDILNHKDEQGNTISHLAASRKQYEVFDLLLDKKFGYKGKLEVNSLNKKGLTPLDVLVSEGGDCEIEEMLTLAAGGAITGAMSPQNSVVGVGPSRNQSGQEQRRNHPKSAFQELADLFKLYDCRLKDHLPRNDLHMMMVAVIAAATYSVVPNPPGGVWQDDLWPDYAKNYTNIDSSAKQLPPPHTAGKAVMATHHPIYYGVFFLFNSLAFFTSLHMMLILTSGLPVQFELRVAVLAIGATYVACLLSITPADILLMFLFLVILLPMMISTLTIVVRHCRKEPRSALPSTRASA